MSDSDKKAGGGMREKLIRSKEEWARAGRLLTGQTADRRAGRLPPGQRQVTDWPVLDLGIHPEVSLEEWCLTIDGLVEKPLELSWGDLRALPRVEARSDIHCVTSWSRFDNHWEGVSAAEILALVRPRPEARHIVFHSYDGYTTNVSLAAFSEADVLLADRWEGQPISPDHGGPLRVVMPRYYFWKSAKWLRRIEFLAADRPGFWEVRGYHNIGDPWDEERYS